MSNKKEFIKMDRFKNLEKAATKISESAGDFIEEAKDNLISRFSTTDSQLREEIYLDKLEDAPTEWNFYDPLSHEKMVELTESIKEKGLMHPLVVWEREDNYIILSGHNRKRAYEILFKATKEEKYSKIPCLIKGKSEISEDEAREIIVDTNWIQRELSTLEKAKSISEKYIRLGRKAHSGDGIKSRDLIAKEYGISGRMVQNYLSLKKILPEFESMLRENNLTIKSAIAISKLPIDMQMWMHENFTKKELKSKEVLNIKKEMTKKDIENLLKKDDEYIRLSLKIPKELKDEFLEMTKNWLNNKEI
ncbi:ParB family chromosome partitioning protein [Acetoanaerobium pronyense]|uniref:ParB family chromosome partitioning protein n=1 Tax=Acetoanaerobium pronyense TaxID=1482736 RepID=A0ABS4KLQ4_9FIRM|nr:ParB/RepB/Spo0J family partition protein [Acetoanaerobium pronyense]MBP2028717.1 ParB family chromosome partitioning protein [Acetoanaerobium pronyense]